MAIDAPAPEDYDVAIVSCDIVGHSSVRERAVQLSRVANINSIVTEAISSSQPGQVIWASGGDGGHVIFRQEAWHLAAVRLIQTLHQWSRQDNVPLRITGHYGRVTDITGADGRTQIVGDAINFAGWLLTRGTQNGVVVSSAFRRALQSDNVTTEIELQFHDPRLLRHKVLSGEVLYLLSTVADRSHWEQPLEEDAAQLKEALEHGHGWDTLYYAKRILQVNTRDQRAASALLQLDPHQLRYHDINTARQTINPFLAHLEPQMLREIVHLGQLVERRYNNVICRFGDAGDTMFVILRGQVGVYKPGGEGANSPADPAFVHQEGEIVGELAFALSRNRTADLVALTDVALLSFSHHEIYSKLSLVPASELALRQVSRFISYRVLEHVSHNAPYLLGKDRDGPLSAGRMPWKDTLTLLHGHCELVSIDARRLNLKLTDMRVSESRTYPRGLYILASGEVRASGYDSTTYLGENFPVLWVDIPDLLVTKPREFYIESDPIKLLYISADGINHLEPRKRDALRGSLQIAAADDPNKGTSPGTPSPSTTGTYDFDVFLCHSSRDISTVHQIAERMRIRGIRYWLDAEQITYGDPITQKIEAGLRRSRFLVPCVSLNLSRSDWARAEYSAIINSELSERKDGTVIPLTLDGTDAVMPPLLRDKRRVSYTNESEFEAFLDFLSRSGD